MLGGDILPKLTFGTLLKVAGGLVVLGGAASGLVTPAGATFESLLREVLAGGVLVWFGDLIEA